MKYVILFTTLFLVSCSSGDESVVTKQEPKQPEIPSAMYPSEGSGNGGVGCGVRTYMLHLDGGDRLIDVPLECDPAWRMKEVFKLPRSLDHQPYE